jgi:lysophospholipase L1-like esterase
MSRERGLKPFVKRFLGRPVQGYADNVTRERLNDLLRAEYEGSGRLFDIARLESAGSEVNRRLRDDFTDDGGHLNEKGRTMIGAQLMGFLAKNLPGDQP